MLIYGHIFAYKEREIRNRECAQVEENGNFCYIRRAVKEETK